MQLPQARQERLIVEESGNELLVYDQARDRVHCLNPSAVFVWRHCDGQTSIAQMTLLMHKEFDTPADEDLVSLALRQLHSKHLLTDGWHSQPATPKISRRELARRLGLGIALLPLVSSILAPTPVMAQTPCDEVDGIVVSDRNAKENFQSVDRRLVLERVVDLPISTWNYKGQRRALRHIGPMAQDFFSAFAIGEDDRHINMVDGNGVALAAIQGLYDLVRERQSEIAALKAELAEVKEKLSVLA